MLDLLKVDSLDLTIEKLYNECVNNGFHIDIEEIDVNDSLDRFLAEDVVSDVNVPEFERSVVDGYAVVAKDTEAANEAIPTFLNVVGESVMGKPCDIEIKSGECVYVPTGAMLPKGATACVMVEYTENITDDKIAIYTSVAEGKSVIKIGDDISKGSTLIKKGKRLTPADIAYLSSIVSKVKVYKKPNITIISTGDELVDYRERMSLGKIKNTNTNALINLSKKYGFNVLYFHLLKDDENLLEKTIKDAMQNSDIIVTSGGSSKGKKDVSSIVINRNTSSGVLTHGIAIKPGKPTITAYDKKTNTIIVGLPGHPVACAVLFKMVVIDVVYKLLSVTKKDYICYGTITENLPSSPGRKTIQLVNIDADFNIYPIYGRSGLTRILSIADGYIILDTNQEGINKGEKVKVYYL